MFALVHRTYLSIQYHAVHYSHMLCLQPHSAQGVCIELAATGLCTLPCFCVGAGFSAPWVSKLAVSGLYILPCFCLGAGFSAPLCLSEPAVTGLYILP